MFGASAESGVVCVALVGVCSVRSHCGVSWLCPVEPPAKAPPFVVIVSSLSSRPDSCRRGSGAKSGEQPHILLDLAWVAA